MLRTITNNRDFRFGYSLLGYLVEALSSRADKPAVLRTEIKELKRALRAFSHRDNNTAVVGMGFEVDRRIIHRDGIDGYIELVEIPEVFDTKESANEFFKEFIELLYYPSAYDCTGQAFTNWYKLFQRNGRYYVYHSVCFDY